jgi:glycosyltransferase involved in cell wall biosynthesis
MIPFLIVSGDFVTTGGMDHANHALADYLARRGHEVHLVAHRAEAGLLRRPTTTVHVVPKLAGSYVLSGPLLDRVGRCWGARVTRRGGRVVVNGGNCAFDDVNWVHYVHAAYTPRADRTSARGMLNTWRHRIYLAQERRRLRRARFLVANSERTRHDLVERLGIPDQRVSTVYYGVDPATFRPTTPGERRDLRERLGWSGDRPLVTFIGALGDQRKGFDTLLAAWQVLCHGGGWDAELVVVGAGAGLSVWKRRVVEAGLGARIRFLGFRTDVADILRASDALVSPTRYEAYGLGVHEALCCGVPALVSADAGVAERYPLELQDLLLPNPENPAELADHLRTWHAVASRYREVTEHWSAQLRAYSWDHMAAEMARQMDRRA